MEMYVLGSDEINFDEFSFQIFLVSQIIDFNHLDFLQFLIFNRKFYSG